MKNPIILISLCISFFVLHLSAADSCPICKGTVTTLAKIKDDISKPNKNQYVWRMSHCGLSLFNDNSRICKNCFFVEDPLPSIMWMRSSVEPDSFAIPLSPSIRNFPVPPEGASYEQRFYDSKRRDGLDFHFKNSQELVIKYQKYCTKHKLEISISETDPKNSYISIWKEVKSKKVELIP
jgi:hypothetical protein